MGVSKNELEKLRSHSSSLILKTKHKNTLAKESEMRIWGYSHREYLYLLLDKELTIK